MSDSLNSTGNRTQQFLTNLLNAARANAQGATGDEAPILRDSEALREGLRTLNQDDLGALSQYLQELTRLTGEEAEVSASASISNSQQETTATARVIDFLYTSLDKLMNYDDQDQLIDHGAPKNFIPFTEAKGELVPQYATDLNKGPHYSDDESLKNILKNDNMAVNDHRLIVANLLPRLKDTNDSIYSGSRLAEEHEAQINKLIEGFELIQVGLANLAKTLKYEDNGVPLREQRGAIYQSQVSLELFKGLDQVNQSLKELLANGIFSEEKATGIQRYVNAMTTLIPIQVQN